MVSYNQTYNQPYSTHSGQHTNTHNNKTNHNEVSSSRVHFLSSWLAYGH